MRKMFLTVGLVVANLCAMSQDVKTLPAPDKNVNMTLYQALQQRKSVREFSEKEISEMQLSQLLWAATGVNRPDGRLTAPTAINAQDISVYVCTKEGAWLYLPKENSLKKVTDKDIRLPLATRQVNVAKAPVNLLIVTDNAKFRNNDTEGPTTNGAIDAGYVSQNIDLACEALGLATVPRAMMEKEQVRQALGLTGTQHPVLNHPVGYQK